MPDLSHFHDCPGCTGAVFCTKTGDHGRSPCQTCLDALTAMEPRGHVDRFIEALKGPR